MAGRGVFSRMGRLLLHPDRPIPAFLQLLHQAVLASAVGRQRGLLRLS
jgi:hypothetical protein